MLTLQTGAAVGKAFGAYTIETADDFTYVDPVDGSVAKKQGIRFLMEDGSRIIFRLSGTAGSGATVRMYLEKYEPDVAKTKQITADVMGELVAVALQLSDIKTFCGTETPAYRVDPLEGREVSLFEAEMLMNSDTPTNDELMNC